MAKNKARKVRVAVKPRVKSRAHKNSTSAKTSTRGRPESVASRNRSEGLRLFKLAGRPTKEQFIRLREMSEDDVGRASSCRYSGKEISKLCCCEGC